MITRFGLAALLCAACAMPASAQAPAQTGTGGGAGSTITAPNTTANGTTKPPGNAAGPAPNSEADARRDESKQSDKIMKGICIGCGAK